MYTSLDRAAVYLEQVTDADKKIRSVGDTLVGLALTEEAAQSLADDTIARCSSCRGGRGRHVCTSCQSTTLCDALQRSIRGS